MAIKSMELEPTRENLLETLSKNLLDRNKSVWQFASFCDAQDGKCSIAIDAKWGSGKTFFVRHVQMLIESFNDFTTAVTEEERTTIRGVFGRARAQVTINRNLNQKCACTMTHGQTIMMKTRFFL